MNEQITTLESILLWELPQVGEKAAHRVLAVNRRQGRSLATFLRLPDAVLREDYELHAAAIHRLCGERSLHESHCRLLAERVEAIGAAVRRVGDQGYPDRLSARLRRPPAIVSLLGAEDVLAAPTLAVLNSRAIDETTVVASHAAVRAAIEQGFTVISGGMKANHRISAVAARAAAAPRVIVLDRGLLTTFGAQADRDPFGFGPRRGPFDSRRTLVVSSFRLADHAVAHNGKRRDELIAALADVIVVGYARPGGVIEHVCLEALDRGQVVLCWYGEHTGLVAAGATPIGEADLAGELRRFADRP